MISSLLPPSSPASWRTFLLSAVFVAAHSALWAQNAAPATVPTPTPVSTPAPAPEAPSKVLTVDSSAFVFSPGNWAGDEGREGGKYRQTWNPGAYVRITWHTKSAKVSPTLLLDTSVYPPKAHLPILACNLDGVWTSDLTCAAEIPISGPISAGKHVLTVFFKKSDQANRWGTPGVSGTNVARIAGLKVDADSIPGSEAPAPRWALIVGDSITEGVGAYEMEDYSHLVGEGFRTLGYEYGVSAAGWSGWNFRGDNPPGDIPGYYPVTDSVNGAGGHYHEEDSRWNRIDANHSLLDSAGHLSGYGKTGQEPDVILINYGTNDAIHHSNQSDAKASMTQCIPVLRQAAPKARLFILIPFGQYLANELKDAVKQYQTAHPDDHGITIIDLGPDAAHAIAKKGYFGDLHPNPRAHATFAMQVFAKILETFNSDPSR